MKQTFEIEQSHFLYGFHAATIENTLKDLFGRRFPLTVTEITEPEKCEFECCEKRSINECPYCGKPIEVRDGK